MRTTLFILLIVCVVLSSCNKGDVRETPTGFKFNVIKKGDGRVGKTGEVIIMDMVMKDEDDSLWQDSRIERYPQMVQIGPESMKASEHGLTEVFRMLSKGDSIVLKMKAEDFFPFVWMASVPSHMDPGTIFTTEILCREVLDSTGYHNFIAQIEAANPVRAPRSIPTDQLTRDMTIIEAFLRSKNMKAENLPSGLSYILKKEGTGTPAKDGDYATMRYAGQNLDGSEFDSGEYGFTVGAREVIEGWDEIAKIMKEGTSLTVFVPSTMAYGHGGRPPVIMPDAILIFDMECLSIKRR